MLMKPKMVISCLSLVVVVVVVLFFVLLCFLHTYKLQMNHGVSMELSQKYNKKHVNAPFTKF